MTTTTIRIEEELKARVAAAAQLSGKTAHAFVLEAIAQKVEQVETDAEFNRLADQRWSKLLATGQTIPWADARSDLEARSRGEDALKPLARELSR